MLLILFHQSSCISSSEGCDEQERQTQQDQQHTFLHGWWTRGSDTHRSLIYWVPANHKRGSNSITTLHIIRECWEIVLWATPLMWGFYFIVFYLYCFDMILTSFKIICTPFTCINSHWHFALTPCILCFWPSCFNFSLFWFGCWVSSWVCYFRSVCQIIVNSVFNGATYIQMLLMAITLILLKSLFISLLYGTTFVRNMHLWDEQLSWLSGSRPWKISQLFLAKTAYEIRWTFFFFFFFFKSHKGKFTSYNISRCNKYRKRIRQICIK